MSQSELEGRADVGRRRIRHDARGALATAALSLGASLLVVGVLRVAVWWLG